MGAGNASNVLPEFIDDSRAHVGHKSNVPAAASYGPWLGVWIIPDKLATPY